MNRCFKFWPALFCLAFILSGCASISDRRRHQFVYIQSTPSGATILDKGQNIGSTPGLARLRRGRKYELELDRAGERKLIAIESKYAWNESFIGNLVLFGMAPFGWLTDLATGAAWNYQDPAPAQFSKLETIKAKELRLALAPPAAENFALSDEAAQYWEKQLSLIYPEAKLIPFKESLPKFQEFGFDFDERPNDEQRLRQVMFNLPTDQVFLSETRNGSNVVNLDGELIDLSGKVLEKKSAKTGLVSALSWKNSSFAMLPSWFQFIPNTVGVEFSNTQTNLTESFVTYSGVETGRRSALGNAVSYLQALTLSRVQLPRFNREARWRLIFTPGARLSYKTLFFPEFSKLADVEFDFLQIGAGIGPEVGYQSGKHYSYLKGILLWTYYQIDWRQPGGKDESMAIGTSDFQTELGYLYFINDRMNIRLFTKSSNGSINLWNSVAQRVNPTTPQLTSANDTYWGLAFGYTFDLHDRLAFK